MADENLSTLIGGGGEWNPTGFSFQQIQPATTTGDLITITGVDGGRVRLTSLHTNTGTSQAGISIIVDGKTVIDEGLLADQSPLNISVGSFWIAPAASIYGGIDLRYNDLILSPVIGKTIIVRKNAGNTVSAIGYAFETGD